MFKKRIEEEPFDGIARLKEVLMNDRAAIAAFKKQLESEKNSVSKPGDKWEYNIFRRIVGDKKRTVDNWFHDKL